MNSPIQTENVFQSTTQNVPLEASANVCGCLSRFLYWPHFCAAIALCVIVALTGCGKSGPERAKVFPVEGQILVNGKPLENIDIVLHPKSNEKNALRARARTDKDGKFHVSTYDTGDGALPGEYAVTVHHQPLIKTTEGYAPGPSDLPEKLSLPSTTDWVIKVAEQPNVIPPKTIAR